MPVRRWVMLVVVGVAGCGSGSSANPDAAAAAPDANDLGPWGPLAPIAVAADDVSNERDGMLSPDDLELYFAAGSTAFQLQRATRPDVDTAWSTPAPIAELDTDGQNFAERITPDGRTLFFSSTRAGGAGGADIWTSTRADLLSPWQTPTVTVGFNGPDDDRHASPCLGATHFVFESDRTGLPDLYEAVGDQVRALDELNSTDRDVSPFVTEDCLTLYYASDFDFRFDIYVARRASVDDPFGPPTKVALRQATGPTDFFDPWISVDQHHLVVSVEFGTPFADVFESFR